MKKFSFFIACLACIASFAWHSATAQAQDFAPFMVSTIGDNLLVTAEENNFEIYDISFDNKDTSCRSKGNKLAPVKNYNTAKPRATSAASLPIQLKYGEAYSCFMFSNKDAEPRNIIIKTNQGNWSFRVGMQDFGTEIPQGENAQSAQTQESNAKPWKAVYYAWLESSPERGTGSIKIELEDYSGETFSSKKDCENMPYPPNMWQMIQHDVRTLNLGKDYVPLRLCLEK